MKIVCLSDTHTMHDSIAVPDGDLLIHAGDFCGKGTIQELVKFNTWLGTLPHPNKVVIAGNHDWPFERDPTARELLNNAIYLQDSEVTINGLRIYGSPWQPAFFNWAFNLERGEALRRKWDLIPDGIDILVTHGPPFGIGDRTRNGNHAGCEELLKALPRVKPRIHICGHIHEGYGTHLLGESGGLLINASNCDSHYRPVNPPIVFES